MGTCKCLPNRFAEFQMFKKNLKSSEVWSSHSEIPVLVCGLGVCGYSELGTVRAFEGTVIWCTPAGVGWGREELAGEKRIELASTGAHPKVPELLTPSLGISLLGTSWKGKDRRPWVWVEGGSPGLNRRPRHLASGALPTRLNPLSPRVLQRGRHGAPVPVGDHQIPLPPKVLTSGTRGYKGRADQEGQAVGSHRVIR